MPEDTTNVPAEGTTPTTPVVETEAPVAPEEMPVAPVTDAPVAEETPAAPAAEVAA